MTTLNTIFEIASNNADYVDKDAKKAFSQLNATLLKGMKEFPVFNEPCSLYRFVGFPQLQIGFDVRENEIMKDLEEGRITLSNPIGFNDPMDPIIRVWAELQREDSQLQIDKNIRRLLTDIMSHFRVGCFVHEPITPFVVDKNNNVELVRPYENTLMWGHYAKGHRGICIKYRISPEMLVPYIDAHNHLCIGDVRYKEHKMLTSDISFVNSMLAKSSSWEYEHETRIVYYKEDISDWYGENEKVKNYISLKGFEIEAICMGMRISSKYKNAIIDLVQRKRNIELYQMDFDPCDLTKLMAVNV